MFPSLPDALPAAAFFPRSAFRITPLKYRSASAARHRKPHSLLQPDANGADANINRPVEKKNNLKSCQHIMAASCIKKSTQLSSKVQMIDFNAVGLTWALSMLCHLIITSIRELDGPQLGMAF